MYAENLKKIRKKLDLSIAKLADELEMSANTISAYERGLRCPSMDFGIQLYRKLNVNLNWFIMGEGNMFNAPKYEDVEDEFEKKVVEIMKKKGLVK